MKKILRDNKGSISALVVISVLLYSIVLTTAYMKASGKRRIQIQSQILAKDAYEKQFNNLDEIREEIIGLPGTNETQPYYPSSEFKKVKETNLDNGLVIEDGNGNQYVWVEVPKNTAVYPTAGLNITNFTDDEYTKIENDLHTYTSVYRNGTGRKDTWVADSNNTGWFTESEYYAQKKTMLKSVYQNGGFYVGRYETGIDASKQKQRIFNANSEKLTIHDAIQTPVIKANAYPYTWINRTQAQVLAKNMNSGNKTSSLMFGVQWDLILAFMHTKGNVSNKEINVDSTNLGNYQNNTWNITNKDVKYSTDDGINYNNCPYEKKQAENVLLTTGSSEKFAHMNIYDIAGNVWEYTLENTGEANRPCSLMGSYYKYNGSVTVSTRQYLIATNYNFYDLGFRIVIY